MKKFYSVGIVVGVLALTACNNTPREQAADNVEANAEAVADNLEDAADDVSNDAVEANLENAAEAVRATGENQAEDLRTHNADTNLKNGI